MNSVNLDLFVSLPSGVTGGCGVVGEAMSEIKVKLLVDHVNDFDCSSILT